MPLDPYQVLGVSKTASQDEIKEVYRKLARKLHPDLNPGNKEAERKFKEISAAYDLIGTPEKRQQYEREQTRASSAFEQAARRSQRSPFYYETQSDPEARYSHQFSGTFDPEFFESLFRGRRDRDHFEETGEDYLVTTEIDLRESVLGTERLLKLPDKQLQVKIPPGIEDGERMRMTGQGGKGTGKAPPGDVYLEIRIRPSETFQRGTGPGAENNLELELPVSLSEAILGGEVTVPTPEGSAVLKIPAGVNTGSKLRLKGKGLADRRTKARGDEIVTLKVALPDPVDPSLKQMIEEWGRTHSYDPRKSAKDARDEKTRRAA